MFVFGGCDTRGAFSNELFEYHLGTRHTARTCQGALGLSLTWCLRGSITERRVWRKLGGGEDAEAKEEDKDDYPKGRYTLPCVPGFVLCTRD
jgi:hypothetical protein